MVGFDAELRAGDLQSGKTVRFEHADGPYTAKKCMRDFGKPYYADLGRTEIVHLEDSLPALKVTTQADTYGWLTSGAHLFSNIVPRDSYTLEYDVRFGEADGSGFDFRRGGKLPGLSGGISTSGGRKPQGDGWTVRYMWREEGALVIYVYHLDMQGKYGDDLLLNFKAVAGQWYRLKMQVQLNSADEKKDGLIKVWVDDKLVLEKNDLRFRKGTQAPIEHFFFAHFWGGQDPSWAPQVTSSTYFRNFELSESPDTKKQPSRQDDLAEQSGIHSEPVQRSWCRSRRSGAAARARLKRCHRRGCRGSAMSSN